LRSRQGPVRDEEQADENRKAALSLTERALRCIGINVLVERCEWLTISSPYGKDHGQLFRIAILELKFNIY
jgi:hypothetical protein